MEAISKLPLDRLCIKLPAHLKALLEDGTLKVYDVLELLANTLGMAVLNIDKNNGALEKFAEDLLDWKRDVDNDQLKFINYVQNLLSDGDVEGSLDITVQDGSITLEKLSDDVKDKLGAAAMLKGVVTDLDPLKTLAEIGLYFYMGKYMRGMAYVSYTDGLVVTQTLLSADKPVYDDGGNNIVSYEGQPCVLTRMYKNSAWTRWEVVEGGSGSVELDFAKVIQENLWLSFKMTDGGLEMYVSDAQKNGNVKLLYTIPLATMRSNGLMSAADKAKLDKMPAIEWDEKNETITINGKKYKLSGEVSVTNVEYGEVFIDSFGYGNKKISADGGSVMPELLMFHQNKTVHYSDGSEETIRENGDLTTVDNDLKISFSAFNTFEDGVTVNYGTGEVKAGKAKVATDKIVVVVTPYVEWHGRSASNGTGRNAAVQQEKASFKILSPTKTVGAAESMYDFKYEVHGDVKIANDAFSYSAQGVVANPSATENKIVVKVEANETRAQRTFEITVTPNIGEEAKQTITITQEAASEKQYTAYVGASEDEPTAETIKRPTDMKTIATGGTTAVDVTTDSTDGKKYHWCSVPTAAGCTVEAFEVFAGQEAKIALQPVKHVGEYDVYYKTTRLGNAIGGTTRFKITKK